MFTNKFIKDLKLELAKELPSNRAHQRMIPPNRGGALISNLPNETTKRSSVLILIYPKKRTLYTVFIKRQEYEGVHSGQIAFPGGKFEKCDFNRINTALREANEEIGINISSVEVLGQLSELFIPPSNFLVLPIVGFTPKTPDFIPDNIEVHSIIEVRLTDLVSTKSVTENEFIGFGNIKIMAPCYNFNNHKIWGATAMIVSELNDVLKNICISVV